MGDGAVTGGEDPAPACDYEAYFGTGLYDARYPAPNAGTLRVVLDLIGRGPARVLDFGCGSGRYAGLILRRTRADVIAYDTSATAVGLMEASLGAFVGSGRLSACCGSLDELARRVDEGGPLDVVLLLFGVLGHVAGSDRRVRLLRRLRGLLRPGGALVLGVPNARRRFRAEQARRRGPAAPGGLEAGDVLYARRPPDGPEIRMFYHLYTPDGLRAELAAAGLRAVRITAESVLPERLVVSCRPLAGVDGLLRRLVPAGLGYGLLAVAGPAAAGPAAADGGA